ncbi:hypothetical protein Tco_0624933 [Tanacetum coccineum]|uniref:Uncharacterized protein n=1 Tax=Tanacetum coccineum TaxID=301880 RepID=A0ABQ4WFB7_9ASTR
MWRQKNSGAIGDFADVATLFGYDTRTMSQRYRVLLMRTYALDFGGRREGEGGIMACHWRHYFEFHIGLASTTIETHKAFLKDEEAEDVDVHSYRNMIGSVDVLDSYLA